MGPTPHCPVCGQSIRPAGAGCPNRWCRRTDRAFSVAFSVGLYQGALRRAIGSYKYRGARHLAPVFAAMVVAYLRAHPVWFEEFDVLTAVPAYLGPGARRSWDPVGRVLDEVGAGLASSWDVAPGLVVKTRETAGMAGLGWAERQAVAREQLRPALRLSPGTRVEGCRVLVLDDVMTDGSTLREVAGALLRNGASDVAGLVLARPAWEGERPGRLRSSGPPSGPSSGVGAAPAG